MEPRWTWLPCAVLPRARFSVLIHAGAVAAAAVGIVGLTLPDGVGSGHPDAARVAANVAVFVAALGFVVTVVGLIFRVVLPGPTRHPMVPMLIADAGVVLAAARFSGPMLPMAATAAIGTTLVMLCLQATMRVVVEQLDRRVSARQLLLVWLVPVVGALVVMAWYDAADFPTPNDHFAGSPGGVHHD